ncbi:hypothetical protein BO78DRAFT_416544 [Aspergillus sclerotiicarbonarius CBS 121057]|uniref:Uncharacterized protein n=1 Tax=Aspergillus sclerotiicarbonarius (strain CBS 121057 / IBT 28362) TaxID=1448318 RepID=A0A319EGM7_ASPSB|nr:hypothetical protein BO78DRAFT_416544 [Aspergillus sclerotiicarbonarius CBS 121057]
MAISRPRKPIDINDPDVWSPKGMFVNNNRGRNTVPPDDDDKAFILNQSNMKALNRFLGTGRSLETSREAYFRSLAITDTPDQVSKALGDEVERMVEAYTNIRIDCTEFKETTWGKITDVAADIRSYATMAGGKVETSYYVLMLKCLGDYHDENKKPNPDPKRLSELTDSILYVVNTETKKIAELQKEGQEVVEGLSDFEAACAKYKKDLTTNDTNIKKQLEDEGADVQSMEEKITEANRKKTEIESEIDGYNKEIKKTPWYMWLGPIGMAVGVGITVHAQNQIKELSNSLQEVKDLLDEYKESKRVASLLVTNTQSIHKQIGDLGDEISPAIYTIQLLQGAWDNMAYSLSSIKELVEFDSSNIPPLLIADRLLQNIVDQWNELKDYAKDYIENSYISDVPEYIALDEYIDELNRHLLRIEGMEKGN